jgi:membrane protease YdiL (CAAX protease family)
MAGGFVAGEIGNHLDNNVIAIAGFVCTLLSFAAIFPLYLKKGVYKNLFKKEKSMTGSAFTGILFLFFGISIVTGIVRIALELGLNQFGLTSVPQVLADALSGTDIFTILSICVLAPIGEELFFRGLILRLLEKHSKKLAIIVSAVLFALMHGNLQQSINAFGLGLVLGYVTVEYNIGWAIALHLFNNLILSDTMPRLTAPLGMPWADLWFWVLIVGCSIAAAVILIVKRQQIKLWLGRNPDDPLCNKAFWSAPGIITLIVVLGLLTLVSTVLMLTPIS